MVNPELQMDTMEILADCEYNTAAFCKIIMPDRFSYPFSPLHYEVFKRIDDESMQKVLIIAPRGFGKTSILQRGFMARRILYNQSKFIVPISKSSLNATNQTESLKRDLLSDPMIKKVWGSIKSEYQFGKDQWIANNKIRTLVMPRGTGQQVRGLLADSRPDLIIGDDVEDIEGVESKDQRGKLKRYIYEDILNSVDYKRNDWRIIFIGSMLHEDSFLANIEDQYKAAIKAGREPDWHVVNLSICDENYKSNWPEAYPDSWIMRKVEEYASLGMLDSFAREFMGIPVSPETNFRKDYFQHYRESELPDEVKERLVNFIIIDPAKTAEANSCETAIVCWGVDRTGQAYYLRDVDHGRYHYDEIIDHVLEMAVRWKARVLGVEVTSLNEFITFPLRTELVRRRKYLHIQELKPRGKKEQRAASLLPLYRLKQVHHNEAIAPLIELPLLSFPRPKSWDVIDAAAYLPELLESNMFYLLPPQSDVGSTPEEVYEELKRQDRMQGRRTRADKSSVRV